MTKEELIEGLIRRATTCREMAEEVIIRGREEQLRAARLIAKASAYEHAAELAEFLD